MHRENRKAQPELPSGRPSRDSAPVVPKEAEATRQGNPPKSMTVTLPDEREGLLSVSFKMPAREALVASANRLLRFEFPVSRDTKVYERLIKTNVLSTGLSKKKLDALPLTFCETIYHQLWEQSLGLAQREDELLNLLVLVEEMAEFIPERLMAADIRLLGLREPGNIPHFYYEDGLNSGQLAQFLALHGMRNDFLQETVEALGLPFQYFACRRLSRPLPWTRLLESLNAEECRKFVRLNRLRECWTLLRSQPWYGQTLESGLTSEKLCETVQRLREILFSPEMSLLATRCQVAGPVQTLVLVEGETERLLLPLFAKAAGHDFMALGIDVLPAGGKNYVPTLYGELSQHVQAGLVVVLDRDAGEIAQELQPVLRPADAVFQIREGEFEDIYDIAWVVKIINTVYQPYPEITAGSFKRFASEKGLEGRVQTLKGLWQAHNLGSFDKIAFAQRYAELFEQVSAPNLPKSMGKLLDAILAVHARHAPGLA